MISIGALLLGAAAFSLSKGLKWAKYFGMSYFEFSYKLSVAIKLLQLGKSVELIKMQTGIDFEYEELAKYFFNKKENQKADFHIYKEGEGTI
jgi:hypothetical protein